MKDLHQKWWEQVYPKLLIIASTEAQNSHITAILNLAGQLDVTSDGMHKCRSVCTCYIHDL